MRTAPTPPHTKSHFVARFAEVRDELSRTAAQRERQRILPFDLYEALRERGFGRLRVPIDHGGLGASIPQLVEVLVSLASADANIVQSWRTHILATERYVKSPPGPFRDRWLSRIAGGVIIGGAWTETGEGPTGVFTTRLTRHDGALVLDGTKGYSTGSLYADWLEYSAVADSGDKVIVSVPADSIGLTRLDDWDGFGQKLTASGTTILDRVAVEETEVAAWETQHLGTRGWQQMVLLAALVGIARGAEEQAVRLVREANAPGSAPDPVARQLLGDLAAQAFAAASVLDAVAAAAQEAHDAIVSGSADAPALATAADLATAKAQTVIVPQALAVSNLLADLAVALAPGDDDPLAADGLDRFWRNARTIGCHNPVIFKQRIVGDMLAFGIDADLGYEERDARLDRVAREEDAG